MPMRLIKTVFVSAAVIGSVYGFPLARRDVDPSLVPQFGVQAGVNPDGTGNCDGINNAAGVPIKIPCSCPPDRASFLVSLNENVAQGHAVNNTGVAVSFPTDDSTASQVARIQASLITLQNLLGPGVGCPAASTTLLAQQKAIQDGTAPPAPAPPAAPPAASPTPSPDPPSRTPPVDSDAPAGTTVDPALVPQFGVDAGVNPSGTGDCDGIPNAAGQPIRIPCSCPPDRASFIQALSANVAEGRAVNNTAVSLSFPTDDSKASQIARIQASLITLQNLNGPGVGCPAASTTLLAQQKAIENGSA